MRFPRPPPVNICLLWFLIGLFYFLYLLWLGRLITNSETPLRYDSGNASENDAKKLTSHAFKLFHDHHISTFHSVIWKLGNQTGPGVRGPRLNSDGWSQIYGIDVRVLNLVILCRCWAGTSKIYTEKSVMHVQSCCFARSILHFWRSRFPIKFS